METKRVYQVIIEQDEDGFFVAECPALRACYTQGRTYEEVMENIRDVISMCLEDNNGTYGVPEMAVR
jgi:predicted RNase H-like HicB family nuclease